MEISDIPAHHIENGIRPEVAEIRRNAPDYFISLIEAGILENINSLADLQRNDLTALDGGISSAGFFLTNNDKPTVIKFRKWGIDAEALTLKAWKEQGVQVPEVYASGILNSSEHDGEQTKYLVMEGITGNDGTPAPTGWEYLRNHPEKQELLAREFGKQLARMHQATTDMPIGGFADWRDHESTTPTIAASIQKQFTDYYNQYVTLGFSTQQLALLNDKIKNIPLPQRGSFIHGDIGLHNVLVPSDDLTRLTIFDPNPEINDPYVDLARMYNRLELKQALAAKNPQDQRIVQKYHSESVFVDAIIKGYTTVTGKKIEPQRLLLQQMLLESKKVKKEEQKKQSSSSFSGRNAQELQVRKDLLQKRVNMMLTLT